MILNFRDKDTALVWGGTPARRFPLEMQAIARRKLRMLNNAATLADLFVLPGNRLESLKGSRKGQHGIGIPAQRRIYRRTGGVFARLKKRKHTPLV